MNRCQVHHVYYFTLCSTILSVYKLYLQNGGYVGGTYRCFLLLLLNFTVWAWLYDKFGVREYQYIKWSWLSVLVGTVLMALGCRQYWHDPAPSQNGEWLWRNLLITSCTSQQSMTWCQPLYQKWWARRECDCMWMGEWTCIHPCVWVCSVAMESG